MLRRIYKNIIIILGCASFLLAGSAILDAYLSAYRQFDSIDPKLEPYLVRFLKIVGPNTDPEILKGLTMGLSVTNFLSGSAVGVCYYSKLPDGGREISISYWDFHMYDENAKESLVFHELAHCLCNIGHSHAEGAYGTPQEERSRPSNEKVRERGYLADGCPSSLMHPIMLDFGCYEAHRELYLNDIYERCNKR